MKKTLFIFSALLVVMGMLFGGCNRSRKYESHGVAPVGTINVVVSGGFTQEEIDQIMNAAEIIADSVSNEVTNDFDVTVQITNDPLPDIHVYGHGNVIVINPGDYFECPDLYERLCHTQEDPDDNHQNPDYDWEGWRNRGHYISCMIAQARGREDCPEDH